MMYLQFLAASASVVALVVCILACVRKKRGAAELDTTTPLPDARGPFSTQARRGSAGADADDALYDEAHAPTDVAVSDGPNYEDVDRSKTGNGRDGSIKMSMSTDSKVNGSISQKPSIAGIPSSGRGIAEQHEGLPVPPLPRTSDPSDSAFSHVSGRRQPSTSQNSAMESRAPEALPRNSSKHTGILGSMSSDIPPSAGPPAPWSPSVAGAHGDDEDDEPPPALPPKTAEAELIYGENIPLSQRSAPTSSCSTMAISAVPPKSIAACGVTPSRSNPSMNRIAAPTVRRAASIKSSSSDMDDAPVLPPKTAEAEMLYDYCDGIKQPPPVPEVPRQESRQQLEYTQIAFKDADGGMPMGSGCDAADGGDPNVYADVTFQ